MLFDAQTSDLINTSLLVYKFWLRHSRHRRLQLPPVVLVPMQYDTQLIDSEGAKSLDLELGAAAQRIEVSKGSMIPIELVESAVPF